MDFSRQRDFFASILRDAFSTFFDASAPYFFVAIGFSLVLQLPVRSGQTTCRGVTIWR
jgi:hypothetical protein